MGPKYKDWVPILPSFSSCFSYDMGKNIKNNSRFLQQNIKWKMNFQIIYSSLFVLFLNG